MFDTGFGEDQFAEIEQSGDDNTASTAQLGENQSARIEQIGSNNVGFGSFARGAEIIQGGNNGAFNDATITQISDANGALINQQGNSLSANVTQGGDGGHASTVTQTGAGGAVLLNADVLQEGADNTTEITQGGSDQTADVTQLGEENVSIISQTGSGHSATVTQNSDLNDSFITQSGTGQTAFVTQGL